MTRQHVQKIVARRAATPGAANNLLKKLRVLLHFAIDNGWRTDDPTIRIKKFAEARVSHLDERGDRQVRADLADRRQGANRVRPACLHRPASVRRRQDAVVGGEDDDGIWSQRRPRPSSWYRCTPELRIILEAWTGREGAILQTAFNRPFSSKGFSNYMVERIGKAGLRLHATRKRLRRRRSPRSAMDRLVRGQTAVEFPNRSGGLGKTGEKPNDFNAKTATWRPVGDSNPCYQRERLVS